MTAIQILFSLTLSWQLYQRGLQTQAYTISDSTTNVYSYSCCMQWLPEILSHNKSCSSSVFTLRLILPFSLSLYFSKVFFSFLLSCWSTRDHIRRSTRNSNPVMTSSAGGAKGCSDHRFRASPAYTAQLQTLHQHRANNQYRTANQI